MTETTITDIGALVRRHCPAARIRPSSLRNLVEAVAAEPELWEAAVRHDQSRRHYRRIYGGPAADVWVHTWPDSAETLLHDHGGSSGAYHVVVGLLTEDWLSRGRLSRRALPAGRTTAFGPEHVHDVGSRGEPAISIHAYSPPLSSMTYYSLADGELTVEASKSVTELTSW